ncbi:MAG: hypothetical protein K2Q22_17815, partial [Cytophagales bacterium]|nr:hypothetical protein [Cytophagales bacterium]
MFKTDDPSDLRPMLLGLLLAMIANSPLVKIYHQYENQTWKYFKNLPIGKFQTLTRAAATMAILCIPELILAFKFTPWNPWSIPLLMSSLYLPSLLTMFYCLLFHPLQSLPSFDNRLFAGGFIWFMAILFGIPVIVFILIAMGTAVWLMNRYYYSYEYLVIEEP